ncbi:phage filamentation protein Fil family protein [Hafnia paralvei]|uniref:phage filamentation protein Fil family protein n=1 Tax=Hafnia TaxID=568 RepID=UPI0009F534CF|nr:phage filamentation protein Fil family protein [Hafnia sp. HMSC23F03]
MTISVAPLLKRQSPSRQCHASHGWVELQNGTHWHPSRNQQSLLDAMKSKAKGVTWLTQKLRALCK